MPLIKLLIISSILGCSVLPKKPQVELCIVDALNSEVICGVTQTRKPIVRKPILHIDHGVAATPRNWEKLKNYLDSLENYI